MKNQKVLIVEDELVIARHIKSILESNGYEAVTNVFNLDEIYGFIDKEQLSLVLLDINLNKNFDGINVGMYLNKINKVPFIYISSYTDPETLEKVNLTRPSGFIVKPFKEQDILMNVSIAINKFIYKKIDQKNSFNDYEGDTPYRIKEVINYINENIEEKIEINDIVNLTQWKKDHFTRTFFKYMGVTPYQFILIRKIEHAKVLLETTQVGLSSLSYILGFGSYVNFYRAFIKYTGIKPEEYRKKKS